MSGIINQVGARSWIFSGGGSASAGTVTLSGTTGLDYEEGTWTPGHSYADAANSGTYIKIGKKVFIEGWLATTASGSSGNQFTGLPFTISADLGGTLSSNINGRGGGISHYQNNNDATHQLGVYFGADVTYFYIKYDGQHNISFGTSRQCHFTAHYTTN